MLRLCCTKDELIILCNLSLNVVGKKNFLHNKINADSSIDEILKNWNDVK